MRCFLLLLAFVAIAFTCPVSAQQDPMVTKYVFNKTIFNPGCTGSNDHLTVNLLHRRQWVGFKGAPVTQILSVHTPLKLFNNAIGFNYVNDKIGATEVNDIYPSYAYRIKINETTKLSIGIQAGVTNWHADWFEVEVEQGSDEVFNTNLTRWMVNFGTGAYLYTNKFYVGLSCPKLLDYRYLAQPDDKLPLYGHTYRHLYATAGMAYNLNETMVFRPSVLVKSTGWLSRFKNNPGEKSGSPAEIDLDASLFLQETLWFGLGYRTAVQRFKSSDESASVWFSWYLRNGLRVGMAYDLIITDIRKYTSGSFELLAGYEFDVKVRKVASVRYF